MLTNQTFEALGVPTRHQRQDSGGTRPVNITPREWLDELWTEPLSLGQIAAWFDCSRNHARTLALADVEHREVGGRFRVRVRDMPPVYVLRLLRDAGMHHFAPSCTGAEVAEPNPVAAE